MPVRQNNSSYGISKNCLHIVNSNQETSLQAKVTPVTMVSWGIYKMDGKPAGILVPRCTRCCSGGRGTEGSGKPEQVAPLVSLLTPCEPRASWGTKAPRVIMQTLVLAADESGAKEADSSHFSALRAQQGKAEPHQELFSENILFLSWRRWRLKGVRWNRIESLQVLS